MVASINKFISLLLMVRILNLWRAGLKFRMLLKKIIDSWREATVVKLVNSLNNSILSSLLIYTVLRLLARCKYTHKYTKTMTSSFNLVTNLVMNVNCHDL